ncbi:hypothetical protein [Vibrio navarrensis]|uniref:hypothetical protein n=1 Tax=Vibrio navarrensis TaxID=29495 RepID=UPI001D04F413|nr:hypothetical protein [Vibrio navarrensis]MBE3652983.1 hypothetical protein [Vibrio navarrensis]
MNSKTKCWMLLLFAVVAGCNDSSVANSNEEKEANQNTGEEKKITFETFQASVLDSLASGDSYHDCGVSELDQDVTDVYHIVQQLNALLRFRQAHWRGYQARLGFRDGCNWHRHQLVLRRALFACGR